ncbi:hypothetical protein VTO42DRAFT_5206 [Malbranchea cinnamomea]
MSLPMNSIVEQMSQLDAARNLVLGDAAFYPQIVSGILPIIGPNARIELRRWGAEFLAETFASPAFAQQPKQKLSTEVLQTVLELLDIPGNDVAVVKSAVQAAASIYPLIFRHIVDHPDDSATWEKMTAIKQTILRKWDTSPPGVKICCIKFVQKVVQVQTQGVISDPRRPEKNETSLAIVPRNHALLVLPNIEAETSGLLDRLLNVFYDNSTDPLMVNATLNCLAVLLRTRPSTANKILDAILNFNPLKNATTPLTPTGRVNIKSMERTTRALLVNVLKRNPNHPLAGRMQQYIERLAQSRNEILAEETLKKRPAPTEPTDMVDSAKRARLGAETPPQLRIPPLPSGPISYAQLFTLTEDAGLTSFDVKQLPADLVVKITVPLLAKVDGEALDQAIGAVRSRYLTLCKKQAFEKNLPAQQPAAEPEDEDEYEPEYEPMDVTVPPPASETEATAPAEEPPLDLALGPFVLPQPPPLSQEEASQLGKDTIQRVFSMITTLEQPSKTSKGSVQNVGFGRLAASSLDRDSWLTLLTRLATRASAGLDDELEEVKKLEAGARNDSLTSAQRRGLADSIREMLYRYVLEDFRVRMNAAASWLNEEWYNDQIQLKHAEEHGEDFDGASVPRHYDRWVMRVLEGILPYLDARDNKVLIRFLSEIPALNPALIDKVKTLANDPERVNLCVQALHYLVLMRPPTRELCLDALEDLYKNVEEARPLLVKVLQKWRPQALPDDQSSQTPTKEEPQTQSPPGNANGVISQADSATRAAIGDAQQDSKESAPSQDTRPAEQAPQGGAMENTMSTSVSAEDPVTAS